MVEDPKIWVALITAGLALLGTGLTLWVGRRNSLDLEQLRAKLQEQREAKQASVVAAEVVARYRDPLLLATYDLQSRCWNSVKKKFLATYLNNGDPVARDYAVENTVFLFAQYLGWTELIRQEVQFLDLGDKDQTRQLRGLQVQICSILQTDKIEDPFLMVWAGNQRAIGELMIERPPARAPHCLGYAAFRRQSPSVIDAWLDPLRKDLRALEPGEGPPTDRLIALQGALIDLLDFLDPDKLRFPTNRVNLAKEAAAKGATAPSKPAGAPGPPGTPPRETELAHQPQHPVVAYQHQALDRPKKSLASEMVVESIYKNLNK